MLTSDQEIGWLIISSSLTVLILVLIMIIFVVNYQRKLWNQKSKSIRQEAEYRLELLSSSIKARENTQERIAKDLHDDLGALLSTARLYVKRGIRENKADNNEEDETLTQTDHILNEALKSIRRIVTDVYPSSLKEYGLKASLEELMERINRAKQIYIDIDYEVASELTKEMDVQIFRMANELINNSLKYAEAKNVKLRINESEESLFIAYSDDGKGFDTSNFKPGMGLKNLESRSLSLKGSFSYTSKINNGFQASIILPKPSHGQN